MAENFVVIKYNHGEIEYLTGVDYSLHGKKASWSTDMLHAELFNMENAFVTCDVVGGFAVKELKFLDLHRRK